MISAYLFIKYISKGESALGYNLADNVQPEYCNKVKQVKRYTIKIS